MEQKKSGVFSGVTMSGPNEPTGFNAHLKIQYKQSCIPLAVSEAAGIQDEHGHSARGSGTSNKSCLCLLVPLPPLEGHTAQGNPKPFGEKDLSSITAIPLLQSARDILL